MEIVEKRYSKIEDRTIQIIQSKLNKQTKIYKNENKMNRALGTCKIIFKGLIFFFLKFLEKEKEIVE